MSKVRQTITLDQRGHLLTSCDSLFPTEKFLNEDLRTFFPFLDSVFAELFQKLETGRIMQFPKVETKHLFLPGVYDYSFRIIRIRNSEIGLQWDVIDATDDYMELKTTQQSAHDKEL